MNKDPVCGMAVTPAANTPKSEYQGKTYFFCSTMCKQIFEREPQKYAAPATPPAPSRP